MADVVDAATRSRMMAGIKGADTGPERALRRALHSLGFRFRLHSCDLPGRPDLVLPKWRVAIFVHGCFWHRHQGCRYCSTPATRPEFWQAKFASNVDRDARNLAALRDQGWRTCVVWECELRGSAASAAANEVAAWLRTNETILEIPSPAHLDVPISSR